MSRLAQALRHHRDNLLRRHELDRAIADANTPGLRDELLLVAQRNNPGQLR